MSFNLNIKRIRSEVLQDGAQLPDLPTDTSGERSVIGHLDADAFFASVQQAADPRLRGKAMAVGGRQRGIVASASYEARKLGIYTPMPMAHALRLCPDLIVVPGDFARFEQFSRLMFSFVYDYTPKVEICSIDEGYFDLGGNHEVDPAEALAAIQRNIAERLKITVSQGLGPNKIISQIASKLRKPRGLICVQPHEVRGFLDPLPLKHMHGLGPVAQKRLADHNLHTFKDLAEAGTEQLHAAFGGGGESWQALARGIDPRPVISSHGPAKSYGHQETFGHDSADEEFLRNHLRRLVDKAVERLREDGMAARTYHVRVRYKDMSETERSQSVDEPGDLPEDFYTLAEALMKKAWQKRMPLRLIAFRLTNLYKALPPADLFEQPNRERREALQNVLTEIRARYGRQALMRGHDVGMEAARRP
jgi:DNA polymerase-4